MGKRYSVFSLGHMISSQSLPVSVLLVDMKKESLSDAINVGQSPRIWSSAEKAQELTWGVANG